MIEISVGERGEVLVRNKGGKRVRVWKVQVEYTTSLPGTLYAGEKSRRLRVREGFTPERDLGPGEELSINTGLDPSSINTVTVYYQEEGGGMGKASAVVNP